jgi:CDP-diacylglycerol--glycerol-3-phosphate 3-phosphatidyltransferase
MNLANRITVARILMVPFLVISVVYQDGVSPAWKWVPFAIFLVASVTDAVDGYLARVRSEQTALGSFLDPFADKLLLVSALLAGQFSSSFPHKVAPWVLIVIVSREILIVSGLVIFYFSRQEIKIEPSMIGKCTTVIQMITAGALLARFEWVEWAAYLAALLTVISGLGYLFREAKRMNHGS